MSSTTQVSPPIPISSAPQPERRSYDGQRAILTGIYVVITIYLGMLLTVLPWKEAWTQNSLVEAFPALRAFLGNNFTRGVVSGLGLVDIWMGVSEAVSFRVLKKS